MKGQRREGLLLGYDGVERRVPGVTWDAFEFLEGEEEAAAEAAPVGGGEEAIVVTRAAAETGAGAIPGEAGNESGIDVGDREYGAGGIRLANAVAPCVAQLVEVAQVVERKLECVREAARVGDGDSAAECFAGDLVCRDLVRERGIEEEGSGGGDDWWRCVAAAAWDHTDRTGRPVETRDAGIPEVARLAR